MSEEIRYKCNHCKIVIPATLLVDGACPECRSGLALVEMCPNDHTNCGHDVVDTIAYCELCGEAMCPMCKSHDVSQTSRITGLNIGKFIAGAHRDLSDVGGWNQGKRAELADRHRVTNGEINRGSS